MSGGAGSGTVDGGAVSVVIPTHDARRWPGLVAAVESVTAQSHRPAEIVVVVDHNDALYDRACRELTGVTVPPNQHARASHELTRVTVLRNRHARGASGTRNTGAAQTTTPLIAFLDDDIVARPDWLAHLIRPLTDPSTVGTGGAIRAAWTRRPGWVPDEFLWAFGGSYLGQPATTSVVRNVWSASMAVRRDAFAAVGGFRVGFGKVGDQSRPEDTDLCLRMARATSGDWLYVPESVVTHGIGRERTTLAYFLRRCYHEGRGKVELARLSPGERLATERAYLRRLPGAVGRGIAATVLGRDRHGAQRAGAIVAGLGAAALGALVQTAVPPAGQTAVPPAEQTVVPPAGQIAVQTAAP